MRWWLELLKYSFPGPGIPTFAPMSVFKPELLAPAGDPTRLAYALAYGADAVYAGQPQFSLRARENGFKSLADLADGIAACHRLGRKFFLTSNVLPRNNKVEPFQRALLEALELKPDALIVADPGLVGWLRKVRPEVELHLSVQANTTNWLAAEFWRDLGVKRIILSRELKMREVLEIQSRVQGLELEVFIHGAVCMAMSGRCMLSNWTTHRDANQGMCSNACRLPYQLFANAAPQDDAYREHTGHFELRQSDDAAAEPIALDEDAWGTYFMSSRDLCALDALPELVDARIASFKIEGRTRSIYYLCQVVRAYRLAIDALTAGLPLPAEARRILNSTDNRGWMTGLQPTDPLPQNFAAAQVASATAQVAGWLNVDASVPTEPSGADLSGTYPVAVKNRLAVGDRLTLVAPQGEVEMTVGRLLDHKERPVELLHPGMKGRIALPQVPEPYAFLVKTLVGS